MGREGGGRGERRGSVLKEKKKKVRSGGRVTRDVCWRRRREEREAKNRKKKKKKKTTAKQPHPAVSPRGVGLDHFLFLLLGLLFFLALWRAGRRRRLRLRRRRRGRRRRHCCRRQRRRGEKKNGRRKKRVDSLFLSLCFLYADSSVLARRDGERLGAIGRVHEHIEELEEHGETNQATRRKGGGESDASLYFGPPMTLCLLFSLLFLPFLHSPETAQRTIPKTQEWNTRRDRPLGAGGARREKVRGEV